MQESILFVTYINKCSIKSRHQLFDPSQIDIAHRKRYVPSLFLKLHQSIILEQCNRNLFGLYVYYKFAGHKLLFRLLIFKQHVGLLKKNRHPAKRVFNTNHLLYKMVSIKQKEQI